MREVLDEEGLPQVSHVEEDAVVAAPLQLGVDAQRHHVARRQLAARVVALHEGLARLVAQDAALAAQRLADEEALRLRMVEHRGVELDELEVGDGRPRPVRHGDAVARRHVGVRGIEVDLAGAARRQHHRLGHEGVDLAAARVQRVGPEDAIGRGRVHLRGHDQVDGVLLLEELQARARRRVEQRALDLAPRLVGGVQHPPLRVPALAGQVVAERRRVAGELRPELDQLAHARRPLRHRDADGLLAAEPAARDQGVADVLFDAVLRRQHRRDPPLRVDGVGLAAPPLGEHGDGPMPGRLQREGEAGDAGAKDQIVELVPHT